MTQLEVEMKLAELRSRAAARCGLRKYPGELIRVSEFIERQRMDRGVSPGRLRELIRRKDELAAGLEYRC